MICKFLCEKSFANKFFEKLFAKIFFEKSFNFYRKADVDHQVLVVGGLGANLVGKNARLCLLTLSTCIWLVIWLELQDRAYQ